MTHTITEFDHEDQYRGMACTCGFTSSTGVKIVDDMHCIAHLESEIRELEEWKRQQMIVSSELDSQRIAKMLGAKWGESCNKVINQRVPEVLKELEISKELLQEVVFEDGLYVLPFTIKAIHAFLTNQTTEPK